MSYMGLELFVREESRRLAAEQPRPPAQYHAERLARQAPAATPRRRVLLLFAGDRLIAIGERLQAWSAE